MPVKLWKGMYFHNGYTVKGLIRNMFQVKSLIVFVESVTFTSPEEIILILPTVYKNKQSSYFLILSETLGYITITICMCDI